jgi:hypothetical protein
VLQGSSVQLGSVPASHVSEFKAGGWDFTICAFEHIVVVPWGDGGWG